MSRSNQTRRATRARTRARRRAREAARRRAHGPGGGAAGVHQRDSGPWAGDPGQDFTFDDDPWNGCRGFADCTGCEQCWEDPGPEDWIDGSADPRSAVTELLRTLAHGPEPSHWVATGLADLPITLVQDAAADLLGEVLVSGYQRGWQPAELVRHVRRRIGTTAAELVSWLVAADARGRPDRHVDPRWQRQLDDLPLPDGVDPDDWLPAWSRWRGVPPLQDCEPILRTVRELARVPVLDALVEPPGVTPVRPVVESAGSAAADPVLQKVRGLLAKAESTEHEAEATAFTAKAQQLMTKHAIDLALVEGAAADSSGPGMVRLPIDSPYGDVKAFLLQVVAMHTRCRAVYLGNAVAMSQVVGYPTDREAVDLLFTSLLVQAQHALAEVTAGAPAGSRERSQAFKSAFLRGFAGRIDDRLAEVNRLAYADERAGTFLPVLQSREARIEAFIDERFGTVAHSRMRGGHDWDGYERGVRAGEAARLTAGAVEG